VIHIHTHTHKKSYSHLQQTNLQLVKQSGMKTASGSHIHEKKNEYEFELGNISLARLENALCGKISIK